MRRLRLVGLLLLCALFACKSEEARLAEHQQRGEGFLKEQKWEEAALEFKNALSIDRNRAAAHYGLAQAHLGANDPRRAYWELEETVRLDPANLDARLRHGEFLLYGQREELERAVAHGDAILAAEPGRWEGLVLRARALAALGRADEAGRDFRAAVETAPDQAAPLLLWANHLRGA